MKTSATNVSEGLVSASLAVFAERRKGRFHGGAVGVTVWLMILVGSGLHPDIIAAVIADRAAVRKEKTRGIERTLFDQNCAVRNRSTS